MSRPSLLRAARVSGGPAVIGLVVVTLGCALLLGIVSSAPAGSVSAAANGSAGQGLVYVSANSVREYDAATGESATLEYIDDGTPFMPSRALNGKAVSWSVVSPDGPMVTYVRETFSHPGSETTHVLEADLYTHPRLSPDGTKLLYIVEEPDPVAGFTNNLHVWRVVDGVELFSIANVDAADWSPDGGKIVFASYARARFDPERVTLYMYDIATTMEAEVPAGKLLALGEVNTFSPRWSPSGDWILFQRYNEESVALVLTDPAGTHDDTVATVPVGRYGLGMEWAEGSDGSEQVFVESVEAGGAPYAIVEVPGLGSGTTETRVLHGAFTGQALRDFTDVPSGHAFYREIRDLTTLRIMGGFADGSFGPGALVKRAQYAKMITVALGVHDGAWTNWNAPSFPDVPRPAAQNDDLRYPFDYVEEAAAAGMVRGDAAGNFRPWAEISRVQLALMIARAGGGRLEPATAADYAVFTDLAGLPQEALDAVALVYHNQIVGGKTATTFAPHAPATRGHAAVMTWRLMERLGMID